MEEDVFGYGTESNGNDTNSDKETTNVESITDIDTGKETNVDNSDNLDNKDTDNNSNNIDDNNSKEKNTDNKDNSFDIEIGSTVEVDGNVYTVNDNKDLIDKNGNIFKKADEVEEFINSFDKIENDDSSISIDSIKDAVGIEITDDNDNPVEFDNTIDGIKSYVNAVIENSKKEHFDTAINTLYQRYPIVKDVLTYYIANNNSLNGFGEIPDRSSIVIDDSNEAQQEAIIRAAWKEQNRKGDVDNYIQYLKSSDLLAITAKEELEGLQESDKQYREQLQKEAEQKEKERIETLENYWNDVHDIIKSKKIAGYQIPDNIVINRDGKKLSVTPEDFFNYIYRVDNEGYSAYERDLAKETPESRRDDEILRAYLKYVGGNYSNLVNMAINKEKVTALKLKAKERTHSSIRINKPTKSSNKGTNIDLGY